MKKKLLAIVSVSAIAILKNVSSNYDLGERLADFESEGIAYYAFPIEI